MGELRIRNHIKRLSFSLSASHPMFWLCSQIGFYPVGARNLYLQPYPSVDWNPTERTSVSLGIPGGSVVRTPWFPCCMPRCDPCTVELRSGRPQAAWCHQNNKRTEFSSLPEALTGSLCLHGSDWVMRLSLSQSLWLVSAVSWGHTLQPQVWESPVQSTDPELWVKISPSEDSQAEVTRRRKKVCWVAEKQPCPLNKGTVLPLGWASRCSLENAAPEWELWRRQQ